MILGPKFKCYLISSKSRKKLTKSQDLFFVVYATTTKNTEIFPKK